MMSRNILFICCLLCYLNFDNRLVNANPIGQNCVSSSTYNPNTTAGTTYRTNLNLLLSTLSSNASRATANGFYNFTAGNDPSNTVYGLFMCRGDVNTDVCARCVGNASTEIVQKCVDQKTATIWYDECLLRYSNQSIFSRTDTSFAFSLSNTQNVTDPGLFDEVLGNLMDEIASKAANDVSGKKFAVQEANFSTFERKLYGLGQCTPDLSSSDCDTCLRSAISNIPTCCNNRRGGRVIFPSCIIWYETTRFYNVVTPSPEPTPTLPPPSTARSNGDGGISTRTVVAIIVPIFIAIVLIVVAFCIARRSRKRSGVIIVETSGVTEISTIESLQYNLSEIRAATDNFAIGNKIGEGGFGPVFKGTLPNGQEIAVKRLSRTSAQGAEEFKNEIALVANLQHRNLVRILGFCLEGEEKILIYEFVKNKSLDYFLFEPEKQTLLDWSRRYKIIEGIARGLLYLHEDSRLRIVHRDLKASNVLLDQKMNPKIADFGMARLFGVDQSQENTNRIAGTFGYMAPEYALHGLFSIKSDVFSFGVLILEIVSGKKNNGFYQAHGSDDLLGYASAKRNYSIFDAWRQWRDGTPLAVVDPSMGDSYAKNEVIRSIQIGLLCVQEDVEQRPTMATVFLMLNSYSLTLQVPNPPAFFGRSRTESLPKELPESDTSTSTKSLAEPSLNEASITELYPR